VALAGDMRVFFVENHHVKSGTIGQFCVSFPWTDLLAFDLKKQRLAVASSGQPYMVNLLTEIVELPLGNGSTLRMTGEHKIMVAQRGFTPIRSVSAGDTLIGAWAGFDPDKTHFMTQPRPGLVQVTGDPRDGGKAKVFTAATEMRNFLCEGVIVQADGLE
jgi:hypothetical protein